MRKSKNYFNKNRNYEHWCKFKTQRNFYQNILRKKKENHFSNTNISNETDNKSF